MRHPPGRSLAALLVLMVAATSLADAGPVGGTVGTRPTPDRAGIVWLCRPGQHPDPCTASLATTVIEPGGARHVVHYGDATDPPVDCFYLYPNVTHQHTANADLDVDPQETAIAQLQASPFSQVCRVFAPMYREATGEGSGDARAVAYASALAAWHDYLLHYNGGRGIVLIGHSEGSAVLLELLTRQIIPSPEVRSRLVSAVLTGVDFPVLTLADLSPCQSAAQTGCLLDYNAYDGSPPGDAMFGKAPPIGGRPVEDVCTNPAHLGGGTGELDSMYRVRLATQDVDGSVTEGILATPVPRVPTPWVEYPDGASGRCVVDAGRHVLSVSTGGNAPALRPFPAAPLGLHVDDPNLAMGDLVDVVRTQAAAYAGAAAHSP